MLLQIVAYMLDHKYLIQKIWLVQVADSPAPWSCAKHLSVQMGTPTPQAYPAGMVPTPRTAPKKPAAMHPQGSRLLPPPNCKHPSGAASPLTHSAEAAARGPSSSQSLHDQCASRSAFPAEQACHADAETVSACKQLDKAAARLAPHSQPAWQAQAAAKPKPPLQDSIDRLPQSNAQLTSACQQLAEAALGHAEQRASLQQALIELSSQHSLSRDGTESAVAAAGPAVNQLEQNTGSSACAALLQAAEASCREDMHNVQAERADERSGNGPEDLTSACEQLTEAVSAHASQHQQLQQLLQQQLAAAPSDGQASAVTACTQLVGQPGRQHQAAKLAINKPIGCSKPRGRVKQQCSAEYTAAWPPGPPEQKLEGRLMQASAAGRAAKGSTSRAAQLLNQTASLGQLSGRAPLQATLTSTHLAPDVAEVGQAGSTPVSSHGTWTHPQVQTGLVHEQEEIRLSGFTNVGLDSAVGTAAEAMNDMKGTAPASSDLASAASGACLEVAEHEAEPSFGAVHAMLSALQLPRMEAVIPWEEHVLAHTCDLMRETALHASEDPPEYTPCRSFRHVLKHCLVSSTKLPLRAHYAGPP